MGNILSLPVDIPDVGQADPRGARQAGCVRVGGGGVVRALPSALGVAVAAVRACHHPGSQHLQALQPQELQTVPHWNTHLLSAASHHWHGLSRTGKSESETRLK